MTKITNEQAAEAAMQILEKGQTLKQAELSPEMVKAVRELVANIFGNNVPKQPSELLDKALLVRLLKLEEQYNECIKTLVNSGLLIKKFECLKGGGSLDDCGLFKRSYVPSKNGDVHPPSFNEVIDHFTKDELLEKVYLYQKLALSLIPDKSDPGSEKITGWRAEIIDDEKPSEINTPQVVGSEDIELIEAAQPDNVANISTSQLTARMAGFHSWESEEAAFPKEYIWNGCRYGKYYGVLIGEKTFAVIEREEDESCSVILPEDENYDSEVRIMSEITLPTRIANPMPYCLFRILRDMSNACHPHKLLSCRLKTSSRSELKENLPLLVLLKRLHDEKHSALYQWQMGCSEFGGNELESFMKEVELYIKKAEGILEHEPPLADNRVEAEKQEPPKKNGAEWDRTELMKKRLQEAGQIDDGGQYNGRPIIGRDTPIDGGVYMGEHQREAIVVDSVKYPEIRKLYKKVQQLLDKDPATASEEEILNAIYSVVSESMEYNEYGVNQIIKEHVADQDKKIKIDRFIEAGMGVCRHQALVCGVLLELFQKEGIIKGKVSVDRNTVFGGHAWCRYTNSEGGVIILDVAQKCFGKLEEVKSRPGTWSYARPEDEENT